MSEPTSYRLQRVRALLEAPPVAELGLDVHLDGDGRVHVAGMVSSDEQRRAVLDALDAAPEVEVVVDELVAGHRHDTPGPVEEIR